MNRDDVLQMAIEVWGLSAVLRPDEHVDGVGGIYIHSDENCLLELERFAALVAAHERKECVQICDDKANAIIACMGELSDEQVEYERACYDCAKAIKARGES